MTDLEIMEGALELMLDPKRRVEDPSSHVFEDRLGFSSNLHDAARGCAYGVFYMAANEQVDDEPMEVLVKVAGDPEACSTLTNVVCEDGWEVVISMTKKAIEREREPVLA